MGQNYIILKVMPWNRKWLRQKVRRYNQRKCYDTWKTWLLLGYVHWTSAYEILHSWQNLKYKNGRIHFDILWTNNEWTPLLRIKIKDTIYLVTYCVLLKNYFGVSIESEDTYNYSVLKIVVTAYFCINEASLAILLWGQKSHFSNLFHFMNDY